MWLDMEAGGAAGGRGKTGHWEHGLSRMLIASNWRCAGRSLHMLTALCGWWDR